MENRKYVSHTSRSVNALDQFQFGADRVGVIASTLCAIHCAVTPFLLLILPTFGKIWAHPATHWGMALLVVPIAVMMMTSGYRKHRRKWIVAMGTIGVALVIIGAIVPYVGNAEASASQGQLAGETGEAGETLHEESCSEEGVDACCPSLTTDAEGNTKLNIPAASIITSLGGLALIVTHLGNLCTCDSCGRRKGDDC